MLKPPAQLFLNTYPAQNNSLARIILQNILVAGAYILTGYLGLRLAFVGHSVTLFWPPSGIAFATLWLGGRRLIPSLMVGAFTVNLITAQDPLLAALIMVGNTTSAISATYLVRLRLRAHPNAGEFQRVMTFVILGVFTGTMVSASVGTTTVSLLSHLTTSFGSTWLVWWMGDAMGMLIVAPPILLWSRSVMPDRNWRSLRDVIGFAAAGVGVIACLGTIHHPLWAVELFKLCTLLLSLWAGARFGLAGPAAMTLLMAVGTVAVTAMGIGPFVQGNFYDRFASVHSYLFAEASAGMVLAAALADLRRAVDRERDALREVEAESANRILLMSMISHDLATPMAGIMGIMNTLNLLDAPQDQKRLIAIGLRAGNALTMLIKDILDISRVDRGRMTLTKCLFSPAQSIEDIISAKLDQALAKNLRMNTVFDGLLPSFVIGDRVRFEQIIGNLVGNAINYTERGHILVKANWDNQLVIDIIDTGPGIPDDRLPYIFDAFNTNKTIQSNGLGLGLHICQKLTELMHGQISYHCVEPRGSRFRVCLPLPKAGQGLHETPMTKACQRGLQILLVDDDQIALEATSALLRAQGHVVTTVESAETAIKTAASRCFDLILTDIYLKSSKLSGIEGARAIRLLPSTPRDCLIFALTGSAFPAEGLGYLGSAVDRVLAKPFDATIDLRQMVTLQRAASTYT